MRQVTTEANNSLSWSQQRTFLKCSQMHNVGSPVENGLTGSNTLQHLYITKATVESSIEPFVEDCIIIVFFFVEIMPQRNGQTTDVYDNTYYRAKQSWCAVIIKTNNKNTVVYKPQIKTIKFCCTTAAADGFQQYDASFLC